MAISNAPRNPWLARSGTNPRALLRLFCFPYAGGAASIFRTWAGNLPSTVEVCPVQLPGHGTRLLERPPTQLEPLVKVAAEALLPYLDKPFAFFGHSMGAIIGYELAHILVREHSLKPVHLFVTGRRAPHVTGRRAPTYNLPEAEFIAELQRLNGTPKQVLENPELMQLLIPIVRADFELIQTYQYESKPPLDCSISAYGGWEDQHVTRDDLDGWQQHTNASFTLRMLLGDHFFLHSAEPLLLQLISAELLQIVSSLNER